VIETIVGIALPAPAEYQFACGGVWWFGGHNFRVARENEAAGAADAAAWVMSAS